MQRSRTNMGHSKHRKAVKRTSPVSGGAKLGLMLWAGRQRRPVRLQRWYGSVLELLRDRRRV